MKRLLLVVAALLIAHASAHAAEPVRIALVADSHVNRGTKEDQPLYRGRFAAVISQINAAKVDVVLVAGDLTQNGKSDEMSDFKQLASQFAAPVFCVPGNHDVGGKVFPGATGAVTEKRLSAYISAMGPDFYEKEVKGARIIGLDSSIFGSGLPEEGKMWDFLEGEASRPFAGPTVVFMHYPPFVHSSDEKGGTYWNIEPAPRSRLLALLETAGVKTVLTGHLHYGLVNRYHGVTIATSIPVSFGLPRGVAPEGWTLVTLEPGSDARIETRKL